MTIDIRDILAWPGGDNSTDTVLPGVHLNLTALENWNYTLYSNGTLSNGTKCYLTFEPYAPALIFPNGTFVNATQCWHPVYPIGARAGTGLGFAVAFGLGLVLTLVALNKHGKLHLPSEKRFHPIGRRWQWYWAIWTCATALISLFTNIDVDRYYLPEIPIVLTCFFWYLMQIGAIACTWEAVRHWGSWMERQFIDPDPFRLRQEGRRYWVELIIPLFAYLFMWLNFFIVVPRSWTKIEHQRYPEQIITDAKPTATDDRFKSAPFFLFATWLITVFSLWHSIRHYCPRNRGVINRTIGFFKFTPTRFMLIIPLAFIIPLYQAMAAWNFTWSPLNIKGKPEAIYPGGYAPSLLIVLIQAIYGLTSPNEDRELIRQRRERGQILDAEMGIQRKPAWWRRVNEAPAPNMTMRDRIMRNVREIGGGGPTARNLKESIHTRAAESKPRPTPNGPASPGDVEMVSIPSPEHVVGVTGPIAPGDFAVARQTATRYANMTPSAASRQAELMMDGPRETVPPPPPYSDRPPAVGETGRNDSVASMSPSINSPPAQIRSMLDV
ncbi:hypothetical protein GE21DRAFT_9540 [Neurospora crassa]|uniref:Uncharacterized protein n=1 Tax=Neurospora crassa (strain ATCC 24698 / 74-OR23-1A / CBS 708.71 / DSM 1257 / FGSC 987) TaxID=367110 RepID=Q7RXB8_NEUCR|nr:hypothetical protein NCU05066 [Neurospora crassa OR74A]EAA27204.1 hypothetical protein NCU05066 [Neurospora crassa OR74A]KHE83854.1 hypothetical protein GE21DRAFT_9540 [Neurospora crassa]|eukprot:XP_956440.1 hypothetical protein NCU05066 [Neurospora crassa OR74A]